MGSQDHEPEIHARCCPCAGGREQPDGLSRRVFLGGVGGAALGGTMLAGLAWSNLAAASEAESETAPPRRALTVKPVLIYAIPQRRPQTSWRSWGGIQTQQDADQEAARINDELAGLRKEADFPVRFLPLAAVRGVAALKETSDVESADVLLVYAAGGSLDALRDMGKDVIFFLRHQSGPVSLHYEIIHPRFLRAHTDALAAQGMDFDDVVVDRPEEVLWRLRALCGLRNTVGARILAIGAPSGWAKASKTAPNLARERFQLDIQTIPYQDLGRLIQEARADAQAVQLARQRAHDYLRQSGTRLETDRAFVDNAFLLERIFRRLMAEADCRALTIDNCMSAIMPMAETTACLPLSLLNDAGFGAYCESDFVVVPAAMLLGAIAGRPVFLNDPTYPHDGVITLAHCTAPRRMDGKHREPARILTHFESDYGAAPKVEMSKGQKVVNIAPDFAAERWVGLAGEIVDHPFLPICRSQIDIRFTAPTRTVVERMPGFHWVTAYGDCLREVGYALKRTGIQWDCLG
ncbi:MAG: sugar isomerase [Candidatus Sumerlaeota bacterium]|nr:sugar isomerase [Candidatus Sumerlaeota bacterium]